MPNSKVIITFELGKLISLHACMHVCMHLPETHHRRWLWTHFPLACTQRNRVPRLIATQNHGRPCLDGSARVCTCKSISARARDAHVACTARLSGHMFPEETSLLYIMHHFITTSICRQPFNHYTSWKSQQPNQTLPRIGILSIGKQHF